MAKSLPWKKADKDVIQTPSRFGSHESMQVFADVGDTGFVHNYMYWVLLRDDRGVYATDRQRLDTGMVDQRRAAPTEFREARLNELLSTENWNSLEEYLAYYGDWDNNSAEENKDE